MPTHYDLTLRLDTDLQDTVQIRHPNSGRRRKPHKGTFCLFGIYFAESKILHDALFPYQPKKCPELHMVEASGWHDSVLELYIYKDD